MRRKPDSAGICEIPDDLIIEILLRLPVKSLLKFRCISKSWRCLISSKQFVESQLNIARNNTKLHSVWKRDRCKFKQYNLHGLLNKLDVAIPAEFYYPLSNEATSFRFIGSYNGLCCAGIGTSPNYYKSYECVFVWNPSTRKSRILPFVDGMPNNYVILTNIGFGFDGADYKVLAMYGESRSNRLVVKLYSSRNNYWKTIDDKLILPRPYIKEGKFANGKLYWIREYARDLFYFDLGSEAYGTDHPLPGSLTTGAYDLGLDVLGEYLSMITHRETSMDVWILKQDGSKYEPWSKMFSIANSVLGQPISIIGVGEILVGTQASSQGFYIYFYDPKSNRLERSNIRIGSIVFLGLYVTSLVSPFPDDCDLNQGERSLVNCLRNF